MNKKYRAVFQAMKPITDGKHPILLISVGQSYHEGAKLLATIELLNRSNFKCCTVMVADSLQRYNFLNSLSQVEAYKLAISLGDQWIERNLSMLNQLIIPYEIIRWDCHYQQSLFYQPYKDQLIKDYFTDSKTKDAIDATINAYLARCANSISNLEYYKFYKSCFDYVLEECPILMPLWAHQGYDFIIYPKKMTRAMYITYEKFVFSHYPNKVIWLPLRFRQKECEGVSFQP